MEGKWKILLVMLGLLVCFGLVYVIAGVISVAAGVGGGLVLGVLSGSLLSTLIFFSALGVLLGYFEYRKIQEIINHKDNY